MSKQLSVIPKEIDRSLLTNTSSGLSKDLAQGKKHPVDVLREINNSLSSKSITPKQREYLEQVKRQLIMREFARSALEQQKYKFPKGAKGKDSKEYQQLISARTGIPVVDASVKSLKEGLPHNRARLLLARHAIRTMNLDPSLVAKIYAKNLKDYDPVLNTFNIVQAASGANFGEPFYRTANALTAAKKLDPKGEWLSRYDQNVTLSKEDRAKIMNMIQKGNEEWLNRWRRARAENSFVEYPLYPVKDKTKSKFFIEDKLPARGKFGPYYKAYLKQEKDLLNK